MVSAILLLSLPVGAGELSLQTLDARTLLPVAGAELLLQEMRMPSQGEGVWSLQLPPGPHALELRAEGFRSYRWVEELDGDAQRSILLSPAEEAAEVVIESRVESPHASRQILDRERTEKAPGVHDDPFRLLQALPGVTATREYAPRAGDLALRGARPAESRVYFEGMELPYLYHFQQYASVLHTRLLDQMALYASSFGTSYGDALGGIIEVTGRSVEAERPQGGANINLIMGGAYLQTPLGDRAGLSVSGRRSYADLMESSNDQYTVWPHFWDGLGRAEWQQSDQRSWVFTTLAAGDRYGRFLGDTLTMDPLEVESAEELLYHRSFEGLSLRTQLQGERRVGQTWASWTGYRREAELSQGGSWLQEGHLLLRHQSLLEWGEQLLDVGAHGELRSQDLRVQGVGLLPELWGEAPLLARGLQGRASSQRWMTAAWLEPRLRWGRALMQPGLRSQWTEGLGWALDPRLTWQHHWTERWGLRAAAGRYHQAPELEESAEGLGSPSLGYARSSQLSAGVDHHLPGGLELGLEAWGKQLEGVVVYPLDEAPYSADGSAWGLELTQRFRLRERLFTWSSLSVGQALRDGAPFEYDQPYAFHAVLSWDFLPRWNCGARYRYVAGLPYTPVESGRYDADQDLWEPQYGELFAERLPDYQKVDLHLERELEFRTWSMALYAQAWWVPGQGNVLYPAYRFDYGESSLVDGPPFLPLLGARAEF